jgi:hypothetical protein
MAEPRYLVDTSVLARARQDVVGDRLEYLARSGALWTCRLIDLEVLYASRARDGAAVTEERRALPEAPITPAVMDRALQVGGLLAATGRHRGAKPAHLVIAAAAEAASLTVLHYDADYDRISRVTHQPMEWVAPAGRLDH